MIHADIMIPEEGPRHDWIVENFIVTADRCRCTGAKDALPAISHENFPHQKAV